VLGLQALAQVLGRRAVALGLEHPGQQLLGRLHGLDVDELGVLARQHEPRLELEQRRDEHQELRRHLEIELAAGLEVVEVGEDDVGQLDLEEVDLLAQDERQQQVEGPGEHLQVELEIGDRHSAPQASDAPRRPHLPAERVSTSSAHR
jgi:hypothetical protein